MALRRFTSGWRQWVAPWYLAYALLGATTGGLVSIFLPLGIDRTGTAAHVGLVMAMVAVGQLTAGLWGALADRFRLHRTLFAGGTVAVVVAFIGFAGAPDVLVWIVLALILGFGTAAANTVANLFIVEGHPKAEWDERIGWLQGLYNAGVVGGLLLASLLTHLALRVDFLVGAALTAVAAVLGWATTRTPPRTAASPAADPAAAHGGPEAEWLNNTPQRVFHGLTLGGLKRMLSSVRTPFGLFMLVWLLANVGAAGVNTLYPLMMRNAFGVQPRAASALMAAATAASLLLYAPSSLLAKRLGGTSVLRFALVGRVAALAGLTVLAFSAFAGREWLAAAAFGAMVLAGPLFTVSGTVIASNLATGEEGESMGIYNATTALGGLGGSVLAGLVAGAWGYRAAPALGLAGVGAALVLGLLVRRTHPTAATEPAQPTAPARS
jgi:MFS transporter, DHA1 family, tetracycline resistance protein